MSSYDRRIISAALKFIHLAQNISPTYASDEAPATEDDLKQLLDAYSCHVEQFVFQSSSPAMLLPPVSGVFPILLNLNVNHAQRNFALRHELAHVIAGDNDGAVFLAEHGYMTEIERVADLFALADLIPPNRINEILKSDSDSVRSELAAEIRRFSLDWSQTRLDDRVTLCLLLHHDNRF